MERPIPLLRMLRATAICFRLRDLIKKSPNSSLKTPITSDEVISALNFCIKETQRIQFSNEINIHSKHAPWPTGHLFARLFAFIDTDGIIRVDGRLENSPNQDQSKHPAILLRNAALTKLIISNAHQRTMHGGTQLTLAFIRQKYWIIGSRQPVRSIVLKCIKCARHRADRAQKLMGQLPVSRVTLSSAFTHTGVDYAGPITLKNWRRRRAKTYKGWICVCVCLSTSAVHLEVVSDNSSTLYSDCGTTFKGAETDLNRLFTQGTQEPGEILDHITVNSIAWHFNPPAAPHMGGKWEAAVKSLKHHLTRSVGESSFTFEEFTTLLTQIEAILNSRPLEPLTEDPDDIDALTPRHFLIGRALSMMPEPALIDTISSRLSRWQFLQQRVQQFWNHWSTSYLQRQLIKFKLGHMYYSLTKGFHQPGGLSLVLSHSTLAKMD
ncbi:uncharacterized protein LOC130674175 [Microplitis mediator]|uniref:uncharacterized protein LOC130674175 n=1 Tax=Microplitis mediator TaxID=375433 RepID=UPI00255788C0|nr:uncharacterized protein LOC130674175 [Microplitis mediator]